MTGNRVPTRRFGDCWGSRLLLGLVFVVFGNRGVQATEPAVRSSPASFAHDVIPILTKAGCNAGVCHAKAGNGQNGFQLSLLGFEPHEDYEQIVRQGRGRRLFPAAPELSLLLQKASGAVAHGGGRRLAPDSEEYRLLRDWISLGSANDLETAPPLIKLDVHPHQVTLSAGAREQLQVVASYADGSSRDVTRWALFETSDTSLAEVDDKGLMQTRDLPGKAAVMIRYQGSVAVCTLTIPQGTAVADLPPAKNFIDQHLFANLQRLGIPPSPIADESVFLRRVTLDIAGRLPTQEETLAFLANPHPEKRDQWIEHLLASPEYADFFANKWTAMLKNRRDDASDLPSNFAFYSWVRDSLLANKPYDQMVRQLLAATGTVMGNPPVAWYKRVKDPKQQLEDVAQLFLGVRVQCAQCHHHPFERWSQDDYYRFAAFFSQVGRKPTATRGEDMIFHKRGVASATNAKTGVVLTPAPLGESLRPIGADEDPRLLLADWMGSKQNPYFARALVNRYWKHFFRRGLIEPEDDIRETNPPTNPELLAALEQSFLESGFDLKALVRVITQSTAYQLSSVPTEANAADLQNYSHFYPRRLQAEVLLDAIDSLAGTMTDFPNLPLGTRAIALPDNSYNTASPFLRVFGRPENESVCECERIQASSLAQSLHLLNAGDIKAKLAAGTGRAEKLSTLAQPLATRITELYQVAFSRDPRSDELLIAEDYFRQPRTSPSGQTLDQVAAERENFQDLIWALINTKEFLFNH